MFRYKLRLSLALPVVLLSAAFAQQNPNVQTDVGAPHRSIADLLRMHDVILTEPSLIAALKNPESEVRWLAAVELQEMKAVDAIPAIKEALKAEKDPRARVNTAVALGVLGDPSGRLELKRRCADESFPTEFRLYAARYMFDLHVGNDSDCLRAAEEIVQQMNSDFGASAYRGMAVSLLPQFQTSKPEDSQKVFELIVQRLQDPEFTVRMEASRALAELGNRAAVPYLRAAIATERVEGTRSAMQQDLEKLLMNP